MKNALALDPLTLMDVDGRELVEIAARNGLPYVGMVFHAPIPSYPADPMVNDQALRREVAARMKVTGVRLSTIECFNLTPDANVDDFRHGLACGHEFGVISATANIWENPDFHDALRKFQRLCDMAAEMNIGVNLEFTALAKSLSSLQVALEYVKASGRRNAGVLVDLLHLMRTGGSIEELRRANLELIGAAQICDGPLKAPEDLLAEAGGGRLPPGQGEFPVKEFVDAIPDHIVIGLEIPQADLVGKLTPDERVKGLCDALKATV